MTTTSRSVRKVVLGSFFAAAAALGLTACSSSGGSCGKVQPCGGNLVGAWRVTGSCVNRATLMTELATVFADFCPSFSLGSVNVTTSGSLSFDAAGTYTIAVSRSGSFKLNIPASCLGGATCADLNAAVAQDPPEGIQSLTCAGTSSCTCTAVLLSMPTNESGTYTTAGTVAMLTSTTGGSNGGDYCVQGDELHLISVDESMGMGPMGQVVISEDIVAKKQ